jgi:hypothetical protein
MKKVMVIPLGLGAVALAAWLGASVWVGHRAQAALQDFKDAPTSGSTSLRMTELKHEKGLLSAKGQAELTLELGCAAQAGTEQVATVQIDYSLSHLLLPTSAARFEWKVTGLKDASRQVAAALSDTGALTGAGTVSINGAMRTDMNLREVSTQRSGQALQIPASKGFLEINGQALAFGWKLDRVVSRGGGQAMEAKDIEVELDLKNRYLGTGFVRFAVEKVSFGKGSLEGVSLRSQAVEKGDQIDFSITPAVRRFNAAGVDLSDVALEMALKGLDTRSVETLSQIYAASCGMESMTAEEAQKARDAAVKLLTRGLSLGVSKVSGKSADGAIAGQLMVVLEPSKTGQPSLATQLKSDGTLEVSGNLVPAPQRELAVQMGMAVPKGAGLVSSFQYAGGLLKVNDRAHDASAFLAALTSADAQIQAVMAQWKPEQAKSVASPPPTPAAAATPQPGAAAAAADPVLARLDGRWYSDEWKYGYTLRAGVGTATVSNSPNFKPGDRIIYLKSEGQTQFAGEQVYKDGKFYPVSVSLMPDGRLAFQGDRGVKWVMRRDD